MIILGLDPGGTCGWVAYDSRFREVIACNEMAVAGLPSAPWALLPLPIGARICEAVAAPGDHCALYGRRVVDAELLTTIRAEGVAAALGFDLWSKARIRKALGLDSGASKGVVWATLCNLHGGAAAVGDDPCPACRGRGGSGRGASRLVCPACEGSKRTPKGPLWLLRGRPDHCRDALAAAYARALEVRDE